MSDDRLLEALRRFGDTRPSRFADRLARSRIHERWPHRSSAFRWSLPRLAPAAATIALALAFGGLSLGAGADSPLWDTRVAIEDLGQFTRLTVDARIAYLQDLLESRTAEVARLEARGNAAAASRARLSRERTLRELGALEPLVSPPPEVSASPRPAIAAATASPTPSATPSAPSTSPASTVAPSRTPALTVTPTRAPTTAPTKPPTPMPTPKPSPTDAVVQPVFLSGTVKLADGTGVTGACIMTSATAQPTADCPRTQGGSWSFVANLKPGQAVTLYAVMNDPARGLLRGSATAVITAPQTQFPPITLKPQ